MALTNRRDWSVVFRSYAALVHLALKVEMQRMERLPTAEKNAGFIDDEQVQPSSDLYHLLLHSTSGLALEQKDSVLGSCWLKGLTHTSGRGLQYDFSGDMLAKLEAYERDLALYEQASGEKI